MAVNFGAEQKMPYRTTYVPDDLRSGRQHDNIYEKSNRLCEN